MGKDQFLRGSEVTRILRDGGILQTPIVPITSGKRLAVILLVSIHIQRPSWLASVVGSLTLRLGVYFSTFSRFLGLGLCLLPDSVVEFAQLCPGQVQGVPGEVYGLKEKDLPHLIPLVGLRQHPATRTFTC